MAELPSHIVKKRTIIKDRVGCVRTSTYDLPANGHAYGMKYPAATEGAGTIISNWVASNPSLEKKTSKMVVYSNVLAVKHGCITARAMRQYGIDHPNIRLKEVLHTDSSRVNTNHEGPFGIKTEFADESMESLLQAKFTNFNNDDADYPQIESIKKTGFMPTPKPTIASQSITLAREKKAEQDQPKHFIMKRFQNIPGTFTLPNTKKGKKSSKKNGAEADESAGYSSSEERPEEN